MKIHGSSTAARESEGTCLGSQVKIRSAPPASTAPGACSERSRIERELRASEAQFARLSESGIVGIVHADVTGHVHDANDACLEMLGYTREDLLAGRLDWTAITPPEWRASDERVLAQIAGRGAAAPFEKELFARDGRRLTVLIGAAMLEPPGCIAFMVDLTERRRAERALRDTEDQLRQAQKMEAVGRLAGGVAHDFNNLLSVILIYSGMWLDQLEPDHPMREDMVAVRDAGNRAAELTRQLLLFSRQQPVEPRVLDLGKVLSDMDRMLQRVLGEDVDLAISSTHCQGRVHVDPTAIEQVVMNLVVNARDAMPTGGKLTVEAEDVVLDEEYAAAHVGLAPGPYVRLAVTDTGVGMDLATQARIFEPFFTTKAACGGTGLGLSTVYGIVQQSGGAVRVYSEPGRGTTFKVYLPRVDAPADATRPSDAPASAGGSETVLLVEDDDEVRAAARGALERSGYQVLATRNAGEALLACERHPGPIALLLSDVVMPQMSGPELAGRLRRSRPEMHVLCMSGYTDESVVRHGMVDARLAFLQKPFTARTLARKVRTVLDGNGGPSQAGAGLR